VSAYTYRMLLLEGYRLDDVIQNPDVHLVARWTPFACGCLGALGLSLRSPAYLWALGILTLIGAVSSRSFYDYLYQFFLRPLTGLGEMPRHGATASISAFSPDGRILAVGTTDGAVKLQPLTALNAPR